MYDCPVQYATFAHKFTGKERFAETASTSGGSNGLDNFGSSNFGRNAG
jgi:hypothetical protein